MNLSRRSLARAISNLLHRRPIRALYFDSEQHVDTPCEIGSVICLNPPTQRAIVVTIGGTISIKANKIIGDIVLENGSKLVKAEIDHFEGEIIDNQGTVYGFFT